MRTAAATASLTEPSACEGSVEPDGATEKATSMPASLSGGRSHRRREGHDLSATARAPITQPTAPGPPTAHSSAHGKRPGAQPQAQSSARAPRSSVSEREGWAFVEGDPLAVQHFPGRALVGHRRCNPGPQLVLGARLGVGVLVGVAEVLQIARRRSGRAPVDAAARAVRAVRVEGRHSPRAHLPRRPRRRSRPVPGCGRGVGRARPDRETAAGENHQPTWHRSHRR